MAVDLCESQLPILQKHVGDVFVLHLMHRLGRNVSNGVLNDDAPVLEHSLVGTFLNQVEHEANLLGPYVGHQVVGHVHGSLVAQDCMDG